MHMADALVSVAVASTMYVCTTATAAYSVKEISVENDHKKIPVMGVMGAFVFATQMINFTIPGTGSSGHLCGSILLMALLGPQAAFLTMFGVLLIQSLLFADGGLLALGCNVWNMAFYGCFVGYYLIWRPIMKHGLSRKKIIIGSVLGSVITLQLGAFSVTLQTMLSGISDLPFIGFVSTMQPIHLVIGLVEGLISAAVLVFIFSVRPEMLQGVKGEVEQNKYSLNKTLLVLIITTIVIGGGMSLLASSNPDGLEWSMEKVAGTTQINTYSSDTHKAAEKVQGVTSVLPDYGFTHKESLYGTSFSGVIGAVVVLIVCAGGCYIFTHIRKKNHE